jgi:hypothetical protein
MVRRWRCGELRHATRVKELASISRSGACVQAVSRNSTATLVITVITVITAVTFRIGISVCLRNHRT